MQRTGGKLVAVSAARVPHFAQLLVGVPLEQQRLAHIGFPLEDEGLAHVRLASIDHVLHLLSLGPTDLVLKTVLVQLVQPSTVVEISHR